MHMRNKWLQSARARFAATAAVVFALVALGGVTATPAYAGPAAIRAQDAVTGQLWYPGDSFVLTNVDSGSQELITTDPVSGYYTHYIADGNYTLTSGDTAHVPSDVFSIVDGTTYYTIAIDTHKVRGTIPAAAGSGLTAASVEYFNGTVWNPVGTNVDPTSVTAADGSFMFRAPQGPADYRLRLQPDASTGYVETVVPFSISGSSAAVTDLGALSLNVARSISGTVYSADGLTPVSGATVHASVGGTDVASDQTDGSGDYLIQLPSTDAAYTVTATGTGYFAQEWDASVAGSETVSVNATDGYARTGVNFALDVEVVPIGGTVLNWNLFGNPLYAQLYSGGTATPTLIEEVEVTRPGGEYVFSSVPTSGTYFIKFRPSNNDAFLDTLLGDGGHSEWSKDAAADSAFSVAHSFTVSVADVPGYAENDVTIEQGVLFLGYLSGGSNLPVDGCVDVIDLDDPTYVLCALPDGNNQWAARVPVGHTYKFHAVENRGEYTEQWWQNEDNETDATEVEAQYAGYYEVINFSLSISPASLYGFVSDVTATDPITVFLYVYANGEFTEVASHATTAGSDEVYFDENYFNGYEGLATGNYRVRFQDSNGMWLAPTSYETGRLPERDGTAVTGADCFVEVPGVTQGRPFYVDATFDAANQDPTQCGPEPLDHRDVSGLVLSTPSWGSVPVANHAVYISNDDDYAYDTTNADGTFTVDYVPTGTFDIDVFPTTHVLGSHEYSYSGSGFVFDQGNVVLDDTLEAVRLGNVYGTIANWDPSMDGAVATVYHLVDDPAGDYWAPGDVSVPVSSTGYFEVPGIDVDGEYAVRLTFPADYAPVFLNGGYPNPTDPFTGLGEQDFELVNPTANPGAMVTLSGTAFFGSAPVENGLVEAHPADGGCGCDVFYGLVDHDGNYTIDVPANTDYEVGVTAEYAGWGPQILDQTYDGHNYAIDDPGPFVFDTVAVGAVDKTGINFSLVASDDVYLDMSTYTSDDYDYMVGIDIHIYKAVGDGWNETAVVTSDVDAWAYLEDQDGGDYRFRFSYGGDWLAVNEVYGENSYPYEDDLDISEVFGTPQCAVDVNDVKPGTYVYSEFYLIEDPTVGDCGPETLINRSVIGSTVQTGNAGGGVIAGQTVTLTNTSTNVVYTETSGAGGAFEFESVPSGDYLFEAPTMLTTSGDAYVGYGFSVTVDDDEDLGPIELTRYGNAEVQITNYDATMAGTTAQVYQLVGTVWEPRGYATAVDSSGFAVAPGVAADGTYTVYLDYPAGFVDGYLAGYDEGVVLTATGYAEFDIYGLDTLAYTTISGKVRLGATWVTGAAIVAQSLGGDDFTATSDNNGSYTVAVPAGEDFTVTAVKTGLVRGIITTLAVGFAPETGVDLAMSYATFLTRVWTGIVTLPTATVHLYRQVSGGWQEVATGTGGTTNLSTNLSGSYRIRISDGANWLSISDYMWDNANDPADNSGGRQYPAPYACFFDFAPASAGAAYEISLRPDGSSAVECGAEPAVVAPPVTPGTTASGTKKPVATVPADEAVAPTSTPTPTPKPSESATAEPDDETAVDKPAAASAPDLTWLFWVSGVLVLLVLAGGAVFLVRRRP